MAKLERLTNYICDWIPDWIWPHLTGNEIPAPIDKDYFGEQHIDLVDCAEQVITFRLSQAEDRSKTVDFKLASLLAFVSVLTAAEVGSLAAATTLWEPQIRALCHLVISPAIAFGALVVLLVYLILQLMRSLYATVGGLRRRGYRQLSRADFAPSDGESQDAYAARLVNLQLNCMAQNDWIVSRKVDEMEIAYISVRNALPAAFLVIVVSLAFVVHRLALE